MVLALQCSALAFLLLPAHELLAPCLSFPLPVPLFMT